MPQTPDQQQRGHTPAPWRAELNNEKSFPFVIFSDGAAIMVETDNNADALLIAAAPELLEACRKVLTVVKGREYQSLKALIARATGTTP